MNILLRLSARPRYWRIAVILPGRILWRTYSREAYPEPEAALRRCLARLALSGREQPQTDQRAEERRHSKAPRRKARGSYAASPPPLPRSGSGGVVGVAVRRVIAARRASA